MGHSQNEVEEETLNDIFQRIDNHGKMLLGESTKAEELNKQKSKYNKNLKLTASKGITFTLDPNENRKSVTGNDRTKLSDNYNKRSKLFRIISRSDTKKKKVSHTRDCSAQCNRERMSPSKFDIRIQSPTRELYKFDVDVIPSTCKSNEALQVIKKSSATSMDTEVTQNGSELPPFDGVEVTVRVNEQDKMKYSKKIKQRKLLGHEGLRLTKPNKRSKGSVSSDYRHADVITPSQQKLINTIMSHICKKGLSSSLKLHIQNLLSMTRESIEELGISSSDNSIGSVNVDSIDMKEPVKKANVTLQSETQYSEKTAVKSEVSKPEKEELRVEAARKTADIISQYSQLSEMLVKKIENLAKVGSRFDESFKPKTTTTTVNGTGAINQDFLSYPTVDLTTESSYLNLPPHVNPNLPVDRYTMKAFSSGNRYPLPMTSSFDELSGPMYFGPPYYIPYQTEMTSKEIPYEQEQLFYYYPNDPAQATQSGYVPMTNNYFVHPYQRETDKRSMPPPTFANGRFRFGVEPSNPPHELHELTTIPEVDTPNTCDYSDSNTFYEQDEKRFINVLDISQSENDLNETSSDSIKSFDSVSSISNIVSMLERNVNTLPFQNRRKEEFIHNFQNKGSQQQNVYSGSSNIASVRNERYRMNTSSSADARNNISGMTRRDHIDFDNVRISPVQYVNYRVETTDNVNPFAGHNKVNNLEKTSNNQNNYKSDAKNAFMDNIIHEKLIQGNNIKQQNAEVSSQINEQAGNAFKNEFKSNAYNFLGLDKQRESHKKEVQSENRDEFSNVEDEKLSEFNEILRDLDDAKEIMSVSSLDDLQLAFHNLGVGWMETHKIRETENWNHYSTAGGRNKDIMSAKVGSAKENQRRIEEDLILPNISLTMPRHKTRKYIN